MSEKMYPIPFRSLMNWILAEREKTGEVFGVHKRWIADPAKTLPIFGEKIESPFGPAAGPNSQLAQNIIAAYVAGARFFEVKTVQKMDGAELAACVPRPCILADDEGYNQEWSTELEVGQALDEYVKAWFALKIMAKVWHYGDPDGFVFNMSVGYDLEGIRGPKIDHYIESMKDASQLPVFAECRKVLTELFPEEAAFIASISPQVSHSVTLSTLHGCPPDEIERIASYLLTEKHVHTFVKCNPTILGYHDARTILDSMGYDYIVFDDHHFNEDLQWKDAVPMFERLQALADHEQLQFGLKLSNTFPVDTTRGELPNDEMYMSGRSLFPLTIEMCRRISAQFGGKMKISFAGGADFFNCDKLLAAGIWPVTVATTILKPGGYNRLTQMAEKTAGMPFRPFDGTDTEAIAALSAACRTDPHHCKPVKPLPTRKSEEKVPWFDCYSAPCRGGCPIAQDIPEYLELCRKGLYNEALALITERNALPFITGTICAHRCMGKCTRNFYEDPVQIRAAKLLAAEKGIDARMASVVRPAPVPGKRAAIIGGGPTGIAAAYFLGRAGVACTIFERTGKLGGIVRHVIPAFRISDEAIDRDIALMQAYGAEVRLNTEAPSVEELHKMGYTHILYATGAWKPGKLNIPGNVRGVIGWMQERKAGANEPLGHVAVVGGGNTAMDAARVAKRGGAASVTLVYRRTRRFMPADAQELELATVPCIVAQLSDADADIMMAETNIQRPDWLPSERAKTYKVWLEAVQTETGITQGQRTDTTSGTECPKLGRNRDVAAQRFGIGPKTLDMYIKLNDLIPELLDMVDANAVDSKTDIQVKAGYQLAFLSPNSQQVVVAVLADNPKILLKEAQAKALRQAETDGRLTALDAEEALGLSGEQLPHRTKRISISISEELLPEGAKQLTKDPAWIRQYIEKEVKA